MRKTAREVFGSARGTKGVREGKESSAFIRLGAAVVAALMSRHVGQSVAHVLVRLACLDLGDSLFSLIVERGLIAFPF